MKPQPDVLGAVVSESVHPGKTSLIVSLIAMPLGATKLYVIDVAEPRMGVAITRALSSRPTITASDVMIETSGALAQFAMVTAIVYPELSAVTAMFLMAAAFAVIVYAVFEGKSLVAMMKATSPQPVVLGAAVHVSVYEGSRRVLPTGEVERGLKGKLIGVATNAEGTVTCIPVT